MHRPLRPACLTHKIESNIPSLNHHIQFLFFKFRSENPRVGSSILTLGTKTKRVQVLSFVPYFLCEPVFRLSVF
jgi:hypothetical protein